MSDSRPGLTAVSSALKAAGEPWRAGETAMTAISEEEFRIRLGFTPPPGAPTIAEIERMLETRRPHEAFIAAAAVGAPAAYDLRNVGGQSFVGPIRDQGQCGSCVAFGTVAVLESSLTVARNEPGSNPDLSEAQLFYCYGRSHGHTCSTGWEPGEALDNVRDGGLAFEDSYPYTAGDQNCSGLDAGWKDHYVTTSGRTNALSGAAIKEWISTRGPVTGCFIVYDDFRYYRSGVYRHVSGDKLGGHCVALIGYDDAQSCWIAKNSWGPGWGDNGFFRIAYGECGIDSWFGPFGARDVALAGESDRAWSGWASEGGVLTSNIAVGRNADARLEVFVRGTDNALWHNWQTQPNGGWSGWASEGGVLTSNIAVASNADGRLEAFVPGSDLALWHNWQIQPNGSWSGWASEGGVLTSDIAVGRNADGRLELFVRGTDNALWHKWQVEPNGVWSDWATEGGVLTSDIAVGANADGRLEVFVRGTDNALWHNWQVEPNGTWSGWATEGGILTSDIAVASNADGRLEAFVRGTDMALWHNWQTQPNGGWSGWASEGGILTSNIAVGRNATGRLEVFVRGTDNALWHNWQTQPNGGWSGWATEGGILTSDIAVASNADGRLEVFVRGTDQALWHNWQVSPMLQPIPVERAVAKAPERRPRVAAAPLRYEVPAERVPAHT